MAGSLGVFIAADLLTFYLVYALVSMPAYRLVAHDDEPSSLRAGGVYMAFALLGEALLLIAFVMLAAGEPNGSVANSRRRRGAAGFALARRGARAHHRRLRHEDRARAAAWLDAAHLYRGADPGRGGAERRRRQGGRDRPDPLSALRRGLPGWGEALAWLGFVSAFYGVAIGITQRNPKTMLAYSSISQMGVIAAALGMALAAPTRGAATTSRSMRRTMCW